MNTIGRIWASPVSAFGWLLAKAGRATPHQRLGDAHEYVAPPTGFLADFFHSWGMIAVTVGTIIIYKNFEIATTRPKTRIHEHRHVYQVMRWGPVFPFAYYGHSAWCWLTGRRAYRDNWFERDARAAEEETP